MLVTERNLVVAALYPDADVYAAALGQPIAIPEPAGIVVPTAQPATSESLLDFVRRHWNTLEFDRPLAMVGAAGAGASGSGRARPAESVQPADLVEDQAWRKRTSQQLEHLFQ